MNSIEWLFPTTVEQALAELQRQDSQAVAGGTTLFDLAKLGHATARRLIDISRLPLSAITAGDDKVSIGALASNSAVAAHELVRAQCPAVSQAILLGASPQIRNAASIGGNLLQATRCAYFRTPDWRCNRRSPGSGCEAQTAPQPSHAVLGGSPSCIATHPSDMAVALLALDATVLVNKLGDHSHRIAVADLYPLPGETPHVTHTLPEGGLVTAVEIPRTELAKRSGYLKLRSRASYEFASASVAAGITLDGSVVTGVAVALGGLGTRPWRRLDAEALLIGKALSPESVATFCDRLLDGAELHPATRHKVGLARGAVYRLLATLSEMET